MLIIFMFLAGASGSVALSNVAGTISDLFGDDAGAGQAMGRAWSLISILHNQTKWPVLPGSLCRLCVHWAFPRKSGWPMDS